MSDFTGRLALVTGAASGIGAASARLLTERGARVVCTDRDLSGARAVADRIVQDGHEATAVLLDVADEHAWDVAIESLRLQESGLDVLVHCAGIAAASPLVDTTLAEWRHVLAVNLDGSFLAVRAGMRTMRARGGAIVLVGSASGARPPAGAAAYATSKGALVVLARAAAKECRQARLAIRVNVVSPAGVRTPMWRGMPFFQDLIREHGSEEAAFAAMAGPGERFIDPTDVARAVAFLASDAAARVTGAELPVDDGYVI
jgi:NAD(P)-dependent dehydrogenase (short-subunit alcohol dehydrogenase family)